MTMSDEDFESRLLEQMGDWFHDEEQFQLARMDRKYYPYTHLFSPIQVKRLYLKNRIVMGPMGNSNMAEEFGRPSEKMVLVLRRACPRRRGADHHRPGSRRRRR